MRALIARLQAIIHRFEQADASIALAVPPMLWTAASLALLGLVFSSPPASPPSPPAHLNPDKNKQVLAELNVEKNNKYRRNRQGKSETYCNIFAMDYAKKMGAPLPKWLDFNNDRRVDDYLDANEAVRWLRGDYHKPGFNGERGPDVGWSKVSAADAPPWPARAMW